MSAVRPHKPSCHRVRDVALAALVAALVVGGGVPATAQQYSLARYSSSEGLPSNRVLSLAQDSVGYLWVGTDGGLGRYDGSTFTTIPLVAGVAGQQVQAVAPVASGIVYATSEGGAGLIGDSARRPLLAVDSDQPINEIRTDSRGALLLAGLGGLGELQGDTLATPGGAPPAGCCRTAWRDDRGGLWAGGDAGLFRLIGGRYEAFRNGLPRDVAVSVLLGDAQENLWAGTSAGLYRVTNSGATLVSGTRRFVVTAGARRANELWFGTTRGALRVSDGEVDELGRTSGLGDAAVNAVLVDRESSVWFGTDNGVIKWVDAPFVSFGREHGLADDFVVAVAATADGVLSATRSGVVRSTDGRRFAPELRVDPPGSAEITAVVQQGESLFVGTKRGVIVRARRGGESRIVPTAPVETLAAVDGEVIVGTVDGLYLLRGTGVERLSGARPGLGFVATAVDPISSRLWAVDTSGSIWSRTPDGIAQVAIAFDGIPVVAVDVDALGGNVWLATRGQGVVKVTPDGAVSRLTRAANGLASDQVRAIVIAGGGSVWACTTRGIDFWSPEQGITHHGLADGLPTLGCNPGAAARDGTGRLWFGTPEGLTTLGERTAVAQPLPPVVVVSAVNAAGQSQDPSSHLRLTAEHANLTFRYSALAFRDEASTRFQYRLLGQTELWSRPTARRTVSYAALGPGEYMFEVQAIGEAGLWSAEPARVRFTILPRPWETVWFRGGASLLGLLVIGVLVWRRLRIVDGERQALRAMVDKRTRELVEKNALLERMATTDELTGLPNRRFFLDTLQRELRKLTRISTDQQMSLLVIDLDRFKSVNDRFGHATGDAVLRQVAGRLGQAVRATDLPARYGGEEFAILLPDTGEQGAGFLAEKLRAEVEAAPVRHDSVVVPVTISVGVATIDAPKRYTPEVEADLIRRADEAMYEAKTTGRNRVAVAPARQSESE